MPSRTMPNKSAHTRAVLMPVSFVAFAIFSVAFRPGRILRWRIIQDISNWVFFRVN